VITQISYVPEALHLPPRGSIQDIRLLPSRQGRLHLGR
jgi:hypothetical protein